MQTIFTASGTASGSEGVTIKANVLSAPSVEGTAKITVGGQTLQLSLGTGQVIGENLEKTVFKLPYTVRAIDASGVAVPNANITMSIRPLNYAKGKLAFGTRWATDVAGAVFFEVPERGRGF